MKSILLFLSVVLLQCSSLFPQVSITSDGSLPDGSAMLEVKSTSKGFLLPRMTKDQILAIAGPANGLVVFCTNDNKIYAFIAGVNRWQELLFGASNLFTCGNSMTINHIGETVAPLNKTVTYNTVTNIPGEPTKCWITQNLGADHQASAVNDATEASAGWYWQFNRQQGFKHDGTTRTPNTAWFTAYNELTEWIEDNDPCRLLLGTGWRIPTHFEWNNVDVSSSWITWNGPWNSALKMHAAGKLDSAGNLSTRGTQGYYWSSSYTSTLNSWYLFFNSSDCGIYYNFKALGKSVRCLRD